MKKKKKSSFLFFFLSSSLFFQKKTNNNNNKLLNGTNNLQWCSLFFPSLNQPRFASAPPPPPKNNKWMLRFECEQSPPTRTATICVCCSAGGSKAPPHC
jgi:hypothetical protein